MEILFDLHTHTLFSDHAFSTVYENILCAKAAGLKGIATTDHGPNLGDAGNMWHYSCVEELIPRQVDGVHHFPGVEADIISVEGDLDIPELALKKLEVVIASFHSVAFMPENEKDLIKTYENVLKNPYVNMLGHIDRAPFTVDMGRIVKMAKEHNVPVELNQHSLQLSPFIKEQAVALAKACNKYEVPVVVNTDSHFCKSVGVFDDSEKMLDEIGFNLDLIINRDFERTMEIYSK